MSSERAGADARMSPALLSLSFIAVPRCHRPYPAYVQRELQGHPSFFGGDFSLFDSFRLFKDRFVS
jgi:hypothetical protein